MAAVKGGHGGTSRFKGVCWKKSNSKWEANIKIDGKSTHLGYFDDEEAAAHAYDEAAARLGRPVNFPDSSGGTKAVKGGRGGTSRFKGVNWHKSHSKWKAKIKIDGKSTHLGYFDDEEEAASAYDVCAALLRRPVNFPAADGDMRI